MSQWSFKLFGASLSTLPWTWPNTSKSHWTNTFCSFESSITTEEDMLEMLLRKSQFFSIFHNTKLATEFSDWISRLEWRSVSAALETKFILFSIILAFFLFLDRFAAHNRTDAGGRWDKIKRTRSVGRKFVDGMRENSLSFLFCCPLVCWRWKIRK